MPALAGKARDIFRNPRVLPNNRIGNRLAGFALPQDRGFPLIGDADRGQIRSAQPALLQRVCNHFFRTALDFQGIMFHPTWLRKNLFVLFLRHGRDTRRLIKHHESRAGRALVDCSNVVFHRAGPLCRRSSILRNCRAVLHANGSHHL